MSTVYKEIMVFYVCFTGPVLERQRALLGFQTPTLHVAFIAPVHSRWDLTSGLRPSITMTQVCLRVFLGEWLMHYRTPV